MVSPEFPDVLPFARPGLILCWPSTWPHWLILALLAALLVFGWVFFLLALRTVYRRGDMG
jgi:hypothetical protein